jgi:hypothetical protein
VNKFKHVRSRVLAPTDLNQLCHLAVAMLQSRSVASACPEHPCRRRALESAVAVLDTQLRFPVYALAVSADQRFPRLDSPYPAKTHQRYS